MSRRRGTRPRLTIVLATVVSVVAALSGCSITETMPAPECPTGGSSLIVAQSVPSASQVPCFDPLPDGWSVSGVDVNQDRSVITFDSDRAGTGAAVLHLDRTCDVSAAVSTASEFPDAERFDQIEQLAPGFRASRFYRFDGGCVRWHFAFDQDASATEAVAVGDALRLIPRQELSDRLSETFIGDGL